MIQNNFDYQRFYYLMFSIITISITDINSKTSTHWFLNDIKEQIVPGNHCNSDYNEHFKSSEKNLHSTDSCGNCCTKQPDSADNNDIHSMESDIFGDKIMRILTDNPKIFYENGTWELKFPVEEIRENTDEISNLDILLIWDQNNNNTSDIGSFDHLSNAVEMVKPNSYKITAYPSSVNNPRNNDNSDSNINLQEKKILPDMRKSTNNLLTCFPYANQTQYDHLNGIYYRDTYKFHPEPEVALVFSKNSKRQYDVKINLKSVEAQLTEAKAKRPNSPNVYNNIGNLLRVHGQSREAVECFRCALRLSPHHPDALLNLARVLYNQNYLEDAIYLTRHSLETQPRNRNPWLQHFTLGEILRSTGHKQEAQYHFMHVLELNPGFRPAKDYLQELGSKTNSITTIYSFCITIFLLSLVFYVLFSNVEFNDSENENSKTPRHFNRGLAMKTLRTLNSKPRMKRNI